MPDKKINIPNRFGAWSVTELIGKGGQGAVVRAQRVHVDGKKTFAAIKYTVVPAGTHTRDAELLAHENDLLKRLRSPHVAQVLDSGIDEVGEQTFYWMATELIRGDNLQHEIETFGPLSYDLWLDLAFDLFSGLAAAHTEGVIHCDVKPGNVVRDSRRSVLVDFGMGSFVKVVDAGDSSGSTPGFEAPEQLDGSFNSEDYEYPVDLFAAGVTLVFAATGWLPWDVPNDYMSAIGAIRSEMSPQNIIRLQKARAMFRDQIRTTPPRTSALSDHQRAIVEPLLQFKPGDRGSAFETLVKIKDLLPESSTRKADSTEYANRKPVSAGDLLAEALRGTIGQPKVGSREKPADRKDAKAFDLALVLSTWLGFLGADRWYLGKYGTAVLKLLTGGGYGAWWVIDALATAKGETKDARGLSLRDQPEDLEPLYRKTKLKLVIAFTAYIIVLITLGVLGQSSSSESSAPSANSRAITQSQSAVAQPTEFVGQDLQQMEDAYPQVTFTATDVSGQLRSVMWDANWLICTQQVVTDSDGSVVTAEVGVVKTDEICP